ncbi:D-alanyl-D-alanine carboxypeptidase family protein [Ectobacillus ponti]|uniref:serine-type D-Ala-D-Ala carboxypeptidase n=1 Tax=Ectobacillus ponti TaxID=2961894 RepID=A0AA42BPR1_9BACI|nr:D-alanyl-D-alanine carboxypeptidase [Ectobacillus ponti]
MKTGLSVLCVVLLYITASPHTYAAFGGVSARNAVLMEQESGRVLYAKQEHDSELIASITKIMTALLASESGKMKDTVTITNTMVRTEGSSIYLKPGQKVKLEDLVYGLMLRSGNDAAQSIAEYVGGSMEGFVYMMNEKAQEIGMKDTHFSNPSGLDGDGNHYSSAYDMALLTRYAMNNEQFRQITGTKTYRSESWDYPWRNKHKLVTGMYEYATGGKTGFTKKAGRTLVTTASKDGMNLIVVTLQASSDWNDHMYLFDKAFEDYEMTTIMNQGGIGDVEKGPYRQHVYLKNAFKYPLTEAEKDKVTVDIQLDKKTDKQSGGDMVGKAMFYLDGQPIGERNVFYSKKKIFSSSGSFWGNFKEVFSSMLGVTYDG